MGPEIASSVLDSLIDALAEGYVSLDEALVSARDRVHDRLSSGAIEPVLDDLEAEQLIRRRYERETELPPRPGRNHDHREGAPVPRRAPAQR
jgi:hypothetical protein